MCGWVCVCTHSCPALCDPLDCSLPGSSVHGNPQPRDQTHVSCVSCIDRWILHHCTTWEAHRRQIHVPKHSGTQTTECVYLLHDSISLFQHIPVILLNYLCRGVIQDQPNIIMSFPGSSAVKASAFNIIKLSSHHIIGNIEMKVVLIIPKL